MASMLSRGTHLLDDWGLRFSVLCSVAAHVALVLLARTRRHHVSLLGRLLLWPVYQVVGVAGFAALSKLSLSGTSPLSSSCEQQLVAFWAPFLLLHLGCPDNISAYALEDNKLSWRQAADAIWQVSGVIYQYIYLRSNSGDLLPASIIMFVLGTAKYIERVVALVLGNLGNNNIRGSSSNEEPEHSRQRVASLTSRRVLDDEQALLLAHSLFNFCRRAMVDDSSVQEEDAHSSPPTRQSIFSLRWCSMCKVVEMELSLMYDILYTKATVIHTWVGYLIRFLSPVASGVAACLFWSFPKDCFVTADIIITYILLVVAFMLDVVWLVRALGSTWAYAFLDARPRIWLHHALLCSGRWLCLRCISLTLDPSNLLLGKNTMFYRKWSGQIGRYNLLNECTRAPGSWSWLRSKFASEDSRYLSPLPLYVKGMLFQRISERLPRHELMSPPRNPYSMKDITTLWGQAAVKRRRHLFRRPPPHTEDPPCFGREFQEDILVWHIGTTIFLAHIDQQLIHQDDYGKYAKAIEVLSEYLMFLVAMRRHMLPGLVLRSLFDVTYQALSELWIQSNEKCSSSSTRARKEKLAEVLLKNMSNHPDLHRVAGKEKSRLIWDGANLAILLLEVGRSNIQELLELIFDVWVDKMLYAGTRCSRESHAKQLSRGGELTTILWIVTEHAGPFRIGECTDQIQVLSVPPLPREKGAGWDAGEKAKPAEKKTEEKRAGKDAGEKAEPAEKKTEGKDAGEKAKKPEEKKTEEKKPKQKKPEEKKPEEKIEDDHWAYYPPPTSGHRKKIEEDNEEVEGEPLTKKGKPTPPPKEESKPEFEPLRKRRFATLYPPY